MSAWNPRTRFNTWANQWRSDFWSDLSVPNNRARARFDSVVFDHGFLRAAYLNLYDLGGEVYRSSQPSETHLRRFADRGFRTIVNLRGPSSWGSYAIEKEVCRETGMILIDHRLFSRAPPNVPSILKLNEIFQTAPRPLLMHCKSGADRAGIGSALYLMLDRGLPVETALKQLSLKYGHVRWSKTGALDHFLRTYADFNAQTPISFLDWVQHHYDRRAVEADFKSNGAMSFVVDKILRRE